MNILQLLFSFKGRIGRKLFWIGILIPICVLASIVKYIPAHYSFDGITEVCFYVLIAIIGLAGLTKRLHDTGNSGLLVLACIIPASITWAISILYNSPPWLFILGYISFLIGLWISIKAMISSGTYGPNKFTENMDSFSFNRIAWLSNIMRKREPGHVENQLKMEKLNLNNATTQKLEIKKNDVLNDWLQNDEPEILRTTGSVFNLNNKNDKPEDISKNNKDKPAKLIPEDTQKLITDTLNNLYENQSRPNKLTNVEEFTNPEEKLNTKLIESEIKQNLKGRNTPEIFSANTVDTGSAVEPIVKPNQSLVSTHEIDRFMRNLKKRSTTSLSHEVYLKNSAELGNSWAKLEIAATWLSNEQADKENIELAMKYLNELANSNRSTLGAEAEAAYFLAEIYRLGIPYTTTNEDLSFKYFVRASALNYKPAHHILTALLAKSSGENLENSMVQSLFQSALTDTESANALLYLIEFDWSITYIESVSLVLRTLVDLGNGKAARHLGRMLLESSDITSATKVLKLADHLTNSIIDKLFLVVKAGSTSEQNINDLIEIVQKHAKANNAYANYQIALAYKDGTGVPQDNLMAYVHASVALARMHGQERDAISLLKTDLNTVLSDEELTSAQTIIRELY